MTQGALAQHIRPLLQSCNTALCLAGCAFLLFLTPHFLADYDVMNLALFFILFVLGTIRLKLLKIGAVITRNTRRVRIWFSSAFPLKDLFKFCLAYFYG